MYNNSNIYSMFYEISYVISTIESKQINIEVDLWKLQKRIKNLRKSINSAKDLRNDYRIMTRSKTEPKRNNFNSKTKKLKGNKVKYKKSLNSTSNSSKYFDKNDGKLKEHFLNKKPTFNSKESEKHKKHKGGDYKKNYYDYKNRRKKDTKSKQIKMEETPYCESMLSNFDRKSFLSKKTNPSRNSYDFHLVNDELLQRYLRDIIKYKRKNFIQQKNENFNKNQNDNMIKSKCKTCQYVGNSFKNKKRNSRKCDSTFSDYNEPLKKKYLKK
ncbi:hypothetical protein Phum_PHUM456150 [Pediculus humanus corporis]|uniref:Uncharacterized protein n=1 Tax=Pediculus humanus subsp. corporis TaxID=121224 RepID=E0VUW3_PEDHC|nr:uncharacterized protein Phum_PHUM456150 [Pediculus humanus corporis]EEB17169.1 hypothetical protein Phum_PHUM456150 [Pediculus humanus corporis]